ncbi:hypothetical protein F5Y17DRAFT_416744 [Xylariaceae sp. FL0594]|nr:hypothetical protein F5Y17DRAFT_416744 [Xylariaceae sp. FL0594]
MSKLLSHTLRSDTWSNDAFNQHMGMFGPAHDVYIPKNHTTHSRIRQANPTPTHGARECYTEDELRLGASEDTFPSIAAMHVTHGYTNMHRGFRYSTKRLLLYYQCQITCLLDEIDSLDNQLTNQFPFDRESFLSRCVESPDQASVSQRPLDEELNRKRENLLSNLDTIFEKYRRVMYWDVDVRGKFTKVSPKTHRALADNIRQYSKGDPYSLEYLRAMGDFVYADVDPPVERFQDLVRHLRLAIGTGIGRFLKKIFWASVDPMRQPGNYKRTVNHPESAFVMAAKPLMMIAAGFMVKVPIGFLYLCEPSKPASFAVMAAYGFVVTIVALVVERRANHLMLGLVADYAIIGAFLSNGR